MNDPNNLSLQPKVQALNISTAGLLVVKKEIGDELAAVHKPSKKKNSKALKSNRKLVLASSDSEAANSPPPLTKKPRSTKTKKTSSIFMPNSISVVLVSQVSQELKY